MTRVYPIPCRSMFCGETDCPKDCEHLPELVDFMAWKEENNATMDDEIWGSTVYHADQQPIGDC